VLQAERLLDQRDAVKPFVPLDGDVGDAAMEGSWNIRIVVPSFQHQQPGYRTEHRGSGGPLLLSSVLYWRSPGQRSDLQGS